jgi:hypothetical protein
VKRIVHEIGTVDKYLAFFGREPRMKGTPALPRQLSPGEKKVQPARATKAA